MRERVLALGAALVALGVANTGRAQCGASHASCPEPAATGSEPCASELTPVLESAARNQLGASAPGYRQIHNGCNKPNPPTLVTATLPCVLMKAVAQTESGWQQFCATCGGSGSTLISFDCGYGIMQITSGMGGGAGFDPTQVASSSAYDVGTGAKILLDKWAATPCVGDNNPEVAEDWYMAVWAYNSFGWVNNPNNPNFPASRPTYHGPSSLSRGSYPYQEIVLGYAAYPPIDSGTPRWTGLAISLPDRAQICNTQGCSVQNVDDPSTIHCDECQRGNTATLLSTNPDPIALGPGATGAVTFQLRNDGLSTWQAGTYQVVKQGGADLGPSSFALAGDVAPGAVVDLSVDVTAPAGGTQSERWALVKTPCSFGPALVATVKVVGGSDGGTSDLDGDGYSGGQDCDDSDATVHVGAPELCDGKDNDCDGLVDQGPDGGPLTRDCSAPGGAGSQSCIAGAWSECVAPVSSAEACSASAEGGDSCPAGQRCVEGRCQGSIRGGCGCSSTADALPLLALASALALARRRYGTTSRT